MAALFPPVGRQRRTLARRHTPCMTKVGFIRTWGPGKVHLAINLADADYDLMVYDLRLSTCSTNWRPTMPRSQSRTRKSALRRDRLACACSTTGRSPGRRARASNGLLETAKPGTIVAIHSTVDPQTIADLGQSAGASAGHRDRSMRRSAAASPARARRPCSTWSAARRRRSSAADQSAKPRPGTSSILRSVSVPASARSSRTSLRHLREHAVGVRGLPHVGNAAGLCRRRSSPKCCAPARGKAGSPTAGPRTLKLGRARAGGLFQGPPSVSQIRARSEHPGAGSGAGAASFLDRVVP